MKECAICGEKLKNHALQCSKGHSLFKPPPRKKTHSIKTMVIEKILRQSSAGYTKDEIAYLVREIAKLCEGASVPITMELIDTMGRDILAKRKAREEEESLKRKAIERWQRKVAVARKRIEKEEEKMQREKELRKIEAAKRRLRFGGLIEKSLPNFRGGNERSVKKEDFVRIISDVFDLLLYKQLQVQTTPLNFDRKYNNNQKFWDDALQERHFESMRIFLKKFHLTEWIPSAPGRYFTREAEESRKEAERYIVLGRAEYLPLGKGYMVLGGVGSLRLGAKQVDSTAVHFLCASSNGISHQGIPVAVCKSEYRKVIQIIKERGGCYTNIAGSLRVLPTFLSGIRYRGKIPRYCLFVEDIEIIRPSRENELLTTVAITFPSGYQGSPTRSTREGYVTGLNKSWSFCSFRGSSQKKLNLATEWLREYANRYSEINNPPILSEFDEHYAHFDNPVEFPISQIFSNDFDVDLLKAYGRYYNIRINIEELIMGDLFKNISSSTIVNRSIVEKSFNKVKTDFDEETAKALVRVAEEIAKSGSSKAAELFAGFNEELQKPEPKKPVLRSLWDGLVKALPSLTQLADVSLKISKLFSL